MLKIANNGSELKVKCHDSSITKIVDLERDGGENELCLPVDRPQSSAVTQDQVSYGRLWRTVGGVGFNPSLPRCQLCFWGSSWQSAIKRPVPLKQLCHNNYPLQAHANSSPTPEMTCVRHCVCSCVSVYVRARVFVRVLQICSI